MKTKFLLSLLLLPGFWVAGKGQERHTISGHVRDAASGEALIGVTVYIQEIAAGTISNAYGFYSISLPSGNYTVQYDFIGYAAQELTIQLDRNTTINQELPVKSEEVEEVIISTRAVDANVRSVEMSMSEMDIRSIEKIPSFAGETDVIKGIQLLPGVSTVGEGASGFNVRGGGVGQNLVLLDEAPVYQASHLFGFFSVFNPDAVKDIKLYKGGIPPHYGGRLSSILDIRMKEGNSKTYGVNGGIGTIFSRVAVEGPIKKNKSSFIVAARRSYADLLAKAFTDVLSDGGGLYFYDLTAKTNFRLSPRDRIYVSGYFGRDVFRFNDFSGLDWGNKTGTLRWNHVYGSRMFSNYTLLFSDYNYGFSYGESDAELYDWSSQITTFNFKPDHTWYIHTGHALSFGGEVILYHFDPGRTTNTSEGVTTHVNREERRAVEASAYLSMEQELGERLRLNYGLRYSYFNYMGGTVYHFGDTTAGAKKPLRNTTYNEERETIADYGNFEPRLSLRYRLNHSSSLKASYNRMFQYIHLISNTTASMPIDVWQPSTNNIQPQLGDQIALGYFRNFNKNSIEASAEIYYKWTQNQVDYIDGADLFVNEFLEGQLLSGRGRAYGVEFLLKKNTGRLSGWLSYTLGRSERKVDGINYGTHVDTRTGDWYPERFDQLHNLKFSGYFDLTERILLSANFTWLSGTPTTYPTDRIVVQDYVIPYIGNNQRNNYRIPDYHRLDLAVTFKNIWRGKKERTGEDELVVSVYNVYARKNPFSVYFSQGNERQSSGTPVTTSSTQVSIIGTIIPAISYNFKF